MRLNLSSSTIDYIVLAYLAISLLIGYRRGVFGRLYDLISTILVFVGAAMLTQPVANNVTFYSGSGNIVDTLTAPLINTAVAFIICLIVLFVIKILLGLILKPLFRHLKDSTRLTHFVGGLLGMALSFVQSLLILYVVLALIIPTIYSNGKSVISQTQVAHYITEDVPDVTGLTSGIDDLHILDGMSSVSDANVLHALVSVSLLGNTWHAVSDTQLEEWIEKDLGNDIIKYGITLSDTQRDQFVKLLNSTNISITKRKKILSKIKESDN